MGVDADEDDVVELETDDNDITADLSHLNVVEGRQHVKSFNIVGTIHKSAVNILVDNGSSHDFIHPRIAEKLSLSLTKIKPFRVYVGNGESLVCSHVSKETVVDLQGHIFHIDLHILAFHGLDIILGMEWLESLGRVTHDYSARTMEFLRDDALVVLRSLSTLPHRILVAALTTLMSHMNELDFFKLAEIPADQLIDQPCLQDEFPQELPPPALHVLSKFSADSASQAVEPLPEEFFISRLVVKPIRLQECRVVMQHGQPVEQGLFQWSDSVENSPTFPSFILEDKDDPMGGELIRVPQQQLILMQPSTRLIITTELVAHGGRQLIFKTLLFVR